MLDFNLPGGLSGLEVCVELRGTHLADRCTIISVSGSVKARDVDVLRQLGVSHFVSKGGNMSEKLVPAIQALRRLAG